MAEYPVLPIFTDAFISDTAHLTAAQTGAYLMLLMCAWRTKDCRLPYNDDQLCRFARMDKRTWRANKDVILSFWEKTDDGHIIQKRLIDERKFADDRRDRAVQAGNASALKRKERHSTGVAPELQLKGNYPLPSPLIQTPLTETLSARSEKNGVLKNQNIGGDTGNHLRFNIDLFLDDESREKAKHAAPGWDIHHLFQVYNEGVRSGKRSRPEHPKAAFVAWCKIYTKGNPP
jgi:uncharacterized protein YdaU (DUF1376 family)